MRFGVFIPLLGSRSGSTTIPAPTRSPPKPTEAATHEASTLMAAVAASTTRVRLGQMCYLVPYRNPPYLAKVTAMVDIVSGGRTEMGVGSGWYEHEWRATATPSRLPDLFPGGRRRHVGHRIVREGGHPGVAVTPENSTGSLRHPQSDTHNPTPGNSTPGNSTPGIRLGNSAREFGSGIRLGNSARAMCAGRLGTLIDAPAE